MRPSSYYRGDLEFRCWTVWALGLVTLLSLAYGTCRLWDWYDRTSCERRAEKLDREQRFSNWTGCLVQGDDGAYYPVENIREPERR